MAKKVGARRGSQRGIARVLPGAQGRREGNVWGDAAQFPRCQDSSLAMARLSEGQRGEWGQNISPGPVGHHLAVPDEMACE